MKKEQKKSPKLPVLIVDHRKKFFESIELKLSSNGITNLECCQEIMDVMPRLESGKYSAVMLDLKMPGINAIELLPMIFDKCPKMPVIVFNDYPENKTTIACIEIGAFDYIFKHVETQELLRIIQNRLHLIDNLELREIKTPGPDNEVEYKTTIYFGINPPLSFLQREKEQEEENKFLERFFIFKEVEVKIDKIEKKKTEEKMIKLEGIKGLIFYYLAYKNYKALKKSGYRTWQDVPNEYEYRLSSNPNNNKKQKPEWKVLREYLKRNEKNVISSNIRSWILLLKNYLKSKGIEDIIDTTKEMKGQGNGYLLKGRVEFSLKK